MFRNEIANKTSGGILSVLKVLALPITIPIEGFIDFGKFLLRDKEARRVSLFVMGFLGFIVLCAIGDAQGEKLKDVRVRQYVDLGKSTSDRIRYDSLTDKGQACANSTCYLRTDKTVITFNANSEDDFCLLPTFVGQQIYLMRLWSYENNGNKKIGDYICGDGTQCVAVSNMYMSEESSKKFGTKTVFTDVQK